MTNNKKVKNKNKARDAYLRKNYNMTLEQYNYKLRSQNNSCDICKKPRSHFKRAFAVDHNHKTGQTRGLLCFYCNHRFVGRFTLETATILINYLQRHEGKND